MPSNPARPVGLLRLARDRPAERLDHLAEIVAVTQHAKIRIASIQSTSFHPAAIAWRSSRTERSAYRRAARAPPSVPPRSRPIPRCIGPAYRPRHSDSGCRDPRSARRSSLPV